MSSFDDPPSDMHHPRDALSRAVRRSDSILLFLESEACSHLDGIHSGLRTYAAGLAKLILHLVESSESADAAEFDIILSVVASLGAELAAVMDAFLE